MLNQFSRTELLYGKEAMERLANARVAIFGLGGVGGYTAEALARSGVGTFDLIDDDKVCLTNLNRQIIATRKTVGKQKVEVMRDRKFCYTFSRVFVIITLGIRTAYDLLPVGYPVTQKHNLNMGDII